MRCFPRKQRSNPRSRAISSVQICRAARRLTKPATLCPFPSVSVMFENSAESLPLPDAASARPLLKGAQGVLRNRPYVRRTLDPEWPEGRFHADGSGDQLDDPVASHRHVAGDHVALV